MTLNNSNSLSYYVWNTFIGCHQPDQHYHTFPTTRRAFYKSGQGERAQPPWPFH